MHRIVGLKIIRITAEGEICSPVQRTRWTDRTLIAAGDGPIAPASRGVHAFRSVAAARSHGQYRPGDWLAVVEAHGETVIGEEGWVAEAATILRVTAPPSTTRLICSLVRARYGVEVVRRRSRRTPPPPSPLARALAARFGDGLARVYRRLSDGRLTLSCPRRPAGTAMVVYDCSPAAEELRRIWRRTLRRRESARARTARRRAESVQRAVEQALRDPAIRLAAERGSVRLGRQPGCTRAEVREILVPLMQARARRRANRQVAEAARRGDRAEAMARRWRVIQRRGHLDERRIRRIAGYERGWVPPIVIVTGDVAPVERGGGFKKYHWHNCGARGTIYYPSTRRVAVGADWLTRHHRRLR